MADYLQMSLGVWGLEDYDWLMSKSVVRNLYFELSTPWYLVIADWPTGIWYPPPYFRSYNCKSCLLHSLLPGDPTLQCLSFYDFSKSTNYSMEELLFIFIEFSLRDCKISSLGLKITVLNSFASFFFLLLASIVYNFGLLSMLIMLHKLWYLLSKISTGSCLTSFSSAWFFSRSSVVEMLFIIELIMVFSFMFDDYFMIFHVKSSLLKRCRNSSALMTKRDPRIDKHFTVEA